MIVDYMPTDFEILDEAARLLKRRTRLALCTRARTKEALV
jgi:hypothetical protein